MTHEKPAAPTGAGLSVKLARHYRWARDEGLARLIDEDQLDPVARARTAWAKASWRRREGLAPGGATAVFVVGLQRSGTNMLVRGLESAPSVEVHNENDRRVFTRFQLQDDAVVKDVVVRSPHRFVLFKPLCDSHRTSALLDLTGGPARAVWIYRSVDDRVRSSVAKFGRSNLDALVRITAGDGAGMWQAGGLTVADLDLLRSLDVPSMDAASGSALFWYLRNKLVFEQSLLADPRVALASYDHFMQAPETTMRNLCDALGMPFDPAFVAGIEPSRSTRKPPLDLAPAVRVLCDQMQERLDSALGSPRPVR